MGTTKDELYLDVLQQFRTEPLEKLISEKLNSNQQQAFIKDVLQGKVEGLKNWLGKKDTASKFIPAYSLSDLAFDFLVSMPYTWLSKHTSFLEKLFDEVWENRESEFNGMVLGKIKSMVAFTQTGLSAGFIKAFLSTKTYNPTEELDLYLLLAKIEEAKAGFEPSTLRGMVNLADKPYLAIFLLYIYRKSNPENGISDLFSLDGFGLQEDIDSKLIESPLDYQQQKYLSVYLRQSIYNWLHTGTEEDYISYLTKYNLFKSPWLTNLFDEVLKHPALEDTREKINQYKTAFMDKEKQLQKIEVIERGIL